MPNYTIQYIKKKYAEKTKEESLKDALEHYKAMYSLLMNCVKTAKHNTESNEFVLDYLYSFSMLYGTIRNNSELITLFKSLQTNQGIDVEKASSSLSNGILSALIALLNQNPSGTQEEALLSLITNNQPPQSLIDLNSFSTTLLTNARSKPYTSSIQNPDAKEFVTVQNGELKESFAEECKSKFAAYYPDIDFICSQNYIDFTYQFFQDIGLYNNAQHDEL